MCVKHALLIRKTCEFEGRIEIGYCFFRVIVFLSNPLFSRSITQLGSFLFNGER